MAHPMPWRSDSLQALTQQADPFPAWHVIVVVLVVIAVMTWAAVRLIGRSCPDCDPRTCAVCKQERERGRRGL